jgi:hypothetical protein
MRAMLLGVPQCSCRVSKERRLRGCDFLNAQSRVSIQQQNRHWRCPPCLFGQPSVRARRRGRVVIAIEILTEEHCRRVG